MGTLSHTRQVVEQTTTEGGEACGVPGVRGMTMCEKTVQLEE